MRSDESRNLAYCVAVLRGDTALVDALCAERAAEREVERARNVLATARARLHAARLAVEGAIAAFMIQEGRDGGVADGS